MGVGGGPATTSSRDLVPVDSSGSEPDPVLSDLVNDLRYETVTCGHKANSC